MGNAVFLPCADGSDRQCWGRVAAEDYSESYFQLTDEQKDDVADLADNYTESGETFEEDIDGIWVEITPAVCGACGSDYTRDDEGNIIID
jgi:hypothetical protein